MPYIVESSLELKSTIIPWNEQKMNSMMKEKEKFIADKKIKEDIVEIEDKAILSEEEVQELKPEDVIEVEANEIKRKTIKRNQKAGEE